MLSREVVSTVLQKAVSTGADFAEVFAEHTKSNVMTMIDGKIESITDNYISGVGVRVYKDLKSAYASTSDISPEGLLRCAENAAQAIAGGSVKRDIVLTERLFGDVHPVKIVPATAGNAVKADIIRSAYAAAKDYSAEIAQVQASLLDVDHNILVANTDGLYTQDRQIRTRLMVNAVASSGTENQSGTQSPGRRMGLEMFDEIDPAAAGREASRRL